MGWRYCPLISYVFLQMECSCWPQVKPTIHSNGKREWKFPNPSVNRVLLLVYTLSSREIQKDDQLFLSLCSYWWVLFFCQAFLGTIPFKGDLIRLMCRKSVWSTRRAISWHKTLPHYGRRRSSKIASDSSESLEKKDQLKGIIRDFELGTERLNPYRKKTKSSVVTSLEPQYPYFFLIASEN